MQSEGPSSDKKPADAFEVGPDLSEGELDFGRYLAVVIHELRNPLNGILGAAQLISEVPLDEECTENVQMILASAESLEAILNDLMDFACVKAGIFRTVAKPFPIRPAIEEVWRTLVPLASDKGVSFVAEASSDVPEILTADRGRVRQVLLNLASNAIKFTSEGKVSIRVEYVPSAGTFSDRLLIIVEDSGVGIPPECLDQVFRPFFRGAQTESTSAGTGLGLFVVGKLVAAMGGTILMKSVEGSGTTVTVNLPCIPNDDGCD